VIIDQFLSAGEQKWAQKCGLVLLLPHGYEGQGPEHSSARLERYLQLSAQNNIQVVMPTTPAQIFHLLRRQMLRKMRTPLFVMTPKSLLRSPLAISSMKDLTEGKFLPVISEVDEMDASKITRVILCSGKVYYDILTQRREQKRSDVAIIRLEQLYPFPAVELKTLLEKYKNMKTLVWAQEEPINQGAWMPMRHDIEELLMKAQTLVCAARPASAAPACGYFAKHAEQQKQVVDEALGNK
jgi:2-oxoglutarate dehydrogenase E1 component